MPAPRSNAGRGSGPPISVKLKSQKHKAIKGDDIIAFFQQLSTLLVAGTPLLRSIQVAGTQSESEKLIALINRIASDVSAGSPLNDAMSKHPKIFEYQWIEMIKAGERSGTLAETMNELTIYIKTRAAVRSQVVSAMIYPCIMIGVLVAALVLMLGKVVPTFAEFLSDFGQELPAITQMVIGASDFVQTHMLHIIGTPIIVGGSLRYYFGTEKGARHKETILLKIPLVGQLVVESTMERFAHNLALLLKSGTPLLGALRIMSELFRNQGVYGPTFGWVYENVGRGVGLAQSMERTGLFTPMVVSMITVGEESGTLTDVLHEVSTFYRAKVEVLVGRVTGMMEPIIVVFMGAAVGGIMMSIYLPMFQMAGGAG